jgi:hypothetical protein
LISGSLNLLELSGPVQACNGIALLEDGDRKRERDKEGEVSYSMTSIAEVI